MSWDLILRHCASIRASVIQQKVGLDLLESQIVGLEAYAKAGLAQQQAPRARIERPATCDGVQPDDCARLHEDAAHEIGGMGGADTQYMCRGCGLNPRT